METLLNSLQHDAIGNFEKLLSQPNKKEEFEHLMKSSKIRATLYFHQIIGVLWWTFKEGFQYPWRKEHSGGIIADEMGVGKTLTAIASICLSLYIDSTCNIVKKPTSPSLIICPKSLMNNWKAEILGKTTYPSSCIYFYYGKNRDNEFIMNVKEKKFIITTYDIIVQSYLKFKKNPRTFSLMYGITWDRIILDEAHKIKNKSTIVHKACYELPSNRRWCMTGTPIGNSIDELCALCAFIKLDPYDDIKWWNKASPQEISQWKADYMLRRTKESCNLQLPTSTIKDIYCTLSENESKIYDQMFTNFEFDFGCYIDSSKPDQFKKKHTKDLLVWILRLRQIACSPMLLLGRMYTSDYSKKCVNKKSKNVHNQINCFCQSDPQQQETTLHYHIKCGHKVCLICSKLDYCIPCSILRDSTHTSKSTKISSKTKAMLSILKDYWEQYPGEKILIFSQFASYLDLIEDALYKNYGDCYERIDGDMKTDQRTDAIEQFTKMKSKLVLISTTSTGGIGINLTCAKGVIFMDQWYNPITEAQAESRVHRIGQTTNVIIYRIISQNTIDESLINIQESKRKIASNILNGENKDSPIVTENDIKILCNDLIKKKKERFILTLKKNKPNPVEPMEF